MIVYRLPQVDTVRIVAYCTKGLVDVSIDELRELAADAHVVAQEENFFVAVVSIRSLVRVANECRTINDLRLLVAGPTEITTERDFDEFCVSAAEATSAFLGTDRECVSPWSVTVSARNPVWRNKPKWEPGAVTKKRWYGADRRATARSSVDLRLQSHGSTAHVALNLTDRPVGKRVAVEVERLGALRSTVAAALTRLAVADPDAARAADGLYDPFCGTGTILAEAARRGMIVYGSDIDAEAVDVTRKRLATQLEASDDGARVFADDLGRRIFQHDIRRGMPSPVGARIIVSNLPWGKQVKLERRGDLFDAIALLVARAVADGGSCALLTTHEEQLASRIGRRAPAARVTTRRIGLLGQTPAVVMAEAQ